MRRVLLVAVASFGLAAAGCGGGGGGQSPVQRVVSASEKGASAGGYDVGMKTTVTAAGTTAEITATGSFDGSEGQLTFDMSDVYAQSGAPAGADSTMTMVSLTEDGHVVMYMRIPVLDGQLPGGKRWIRLDVQEAGSELGIDVDALLGQSSGANPADVLELLRTSGEVEEIGPALVDGVETTQYRATIDVEEALARHGLSERTAATFRSLVDARELPIDVWVGDADGLPYRLSMSYSIEQAGQPASASVEMTMTNWGSDVSVVAPPTDDVLDVTGLVGGSGP